MADAPNIAVVDTGGANLASLLYAFQRLGHQAFVTKDTAQVRAASHVVLPGVGAAGDAMQRLDATGLSDVLVDLKQPVLGICLGMHLLATQSAEDDTACLDVIAAPVLRIPAVDGLCVPHMGWNQVESTTSSALLRGLPDKPYFYFVHSYAIRADAPGCAGTYHYGSPYAAIMQRNNFYAVQFHPERSSHHGQRLLQNFLDLSAC